MSPDAQPERSDVVGMLRDEYAHIHGPPGPDLPDADLDTRLQAFYERVHALDVSRSALCLSGGGIRSASFSLGILQGLARAGVLHKFHYLSTVSGGGYIGSWLTALIHRHFVASEGGAAPGAPAGRPRRESAATLLNRLANLVATSPGAGPDDQPGSRPGAAIVGGLLDRNAGLGADRPPEPAQIARLRRFTNYLSPRTGAFSLDTWTLAAVYVRNLVLNWLVVVPLLVAVLAIPHVAAAALGAAWAGGEMAVLATIVAPAAALLAVQALLVAWDAFAAPSTDVGAVEGRARWEGALLMIAGSWVAFASLVLLGPDLLARLPRAARVLLSAAGGVSGLATWLLKRRGDADAAVGQRAEAPARRARLATAAAALVTILLILTFVASGVGALLARARAWLEPAALPAPVPPALGAAVAVAAAALAVSALAALVVDVNEFSLHALYRNRLVRAFLRPSRGKDAPARDTVFDPRDDVPLRNLWPSSPARADAPPEEARYLFHVVNATLNDVGRSRPEWDERKGVSFTFSPLHYGAHVPGGMGAAGARECYRTQSRSGPSRLTLGTAMTISGAAANPNMGYHSSPVVTLLMALFNVRLGWWLHAPWHPHAGGRPRRSPATAWRVWSREALGTTRFGTSLINVSDGGHFDNLGLYEMIRRRCRHIVIVDAGEDRRDDFASLGEALRRIRVDFGVPITLTALDLSDPAMRSSPVHAWHGTVHYSQVDRVGPGGVPAPDGELVYFKPAVSGDEPVDVQAYRRLHGAFPHESTTDQWFSESQFESYRTLGEHSVRHILAYYDAARGTAAAPARAARASAVGRTALRARDGAAAGGGLTPRDFCYRAGEALALMKRHRDASSHAGGVVYRVREDAELEFLLVIAADHSHRVLPKGHIEPWEDAITAAVREVREEAAFELVPERTLGVFRFETAGRNVTTTYFLMRAPGPHAPGEPHEAHRDPRWYTLDEVPRAEPSVPQDVVEVLRQAREVLRPAAPAAPRATHAGGIAYRRRPDGTLEFLLVRSDDGSALVIPKGHVEPGEAPADAAEREMREEAGLRLACERALGEFTFARAGDAVRTLYFTMPAPAPEPGRDPAWLTLGAARTAEPRVPPDVLDILAQAAAALEDGATD
jgi:8-oxo-dGTP pyrophosphatase MutT (NUDIX family)